MKLQFGDNYTFGNVTNSNITIKAKLNEVRQVIYAAPLSSAQDKASLNTLVEQLEVALREVPVSREEETGAILATVKELIEEVSKPKLNKALINVKASGLKEAAMALEAVSPTILVIATQIVTHVRKMTLG
jgi:hypothetical protein